MLAPKYIIFTIGGIAIASGIATYVVHNDHFATITEVKPFVLQIKTPYTECNYKNKTTYTKPGDHYNVIGGVAGGATGAVVAHAISANPVVLAGGAIAGVFGGQVIEEHVKKPKAHTYKQKNCVTQYKEVESPAGYLVSFTYHQQAGVRVLKNKPLDNKIDIAILDAAPTPEQVH